MSSVDVEQILRRGRKAIRAKRDVEEAAKLGELRGGSSGAMIGAEAIGTCPRLAYLRYIGIKLPSDLDGKDLETEESGPSAFGAPESKAFLQREVKDLELMMEAGRLNELAWSDRIEAGLEEGHTLLCEEDIPIRYVFQRMDGKAVTVSGRPDAVICRVLSEGESMTAQRSRGDIQPLLLIEHKNASALWSCATYFCHGAPKIGHLIQTAFYSWQLDCDAELWYTNRVYYQIGMNHRFYIPKAGTPGSQFVEYEEEMNSRTKRKETVPKKLIPAKIVFKLSWTNKGQLTYVNPLTGEVVHTPITRDGVLRFYTAVADAGTSNVLPPRISTVDSQGKKKSQSECVYCVLNTMCKNYKGTKTDEWLRTVRNVSGVTEISAQEKA